MADSLSQLRNKRDAQVGKALLALSERLMDLSDMAEKVAQIIEPTD